ncbi:NAD(+) synthase [Mesonia sp. HuA40]|uniref:NAD(+) synthase n=1 Tax=Mesonia sp. HuA40 TaxID=2602761 RepID=UPI0011CB218A|nr:NAD(+) synthase [Mesonia sp. HuA40]TXK73703.1 NAD(+) synthase [Mesonia sp. HuA40]
MQTDKVSEHIVNWLKNYSTQAKTNGFVVGISGGIDSAVTSTLCAQTGLRTLCIEMPIHQAASQMQRGKEHIQNLKREFSNVSSLEVDLTPSFESLKNSFPSTPDTDQLALTLANTRARLRMTTLYYFAGLHGYLVAGTGNKIEDFGVGFFTKYGDGGVDLSPIADLLKSEVYALGEYLNVAPSILKAAPTDGLFGDSRTDEDQLGASYDELEWAMAYTTNPTDHKLTPRQETVLNIYTRLNRANLHKINPIPVCNIPPHLK